MKASSAVRASAGTSSLPAIRSGIHDGPAEAGGRLPLRRRAGYGDAGAAHLRLLCGCHPPDGGSGHARPHVVFMTAAGTPLTEEKVQAACPKDSLLLVCGHYEGIDERVIEALADEEISIGDYVLTGGELCGAGGGGQRVPPVPGRAFQPGRLRRRRAITVACLSIPSIAARRNGTAAACRRSCFQATTQTSQNGGMNRHWAHAHPPSGSIREIRRKVNGENR